MQERKKAEAVNKTIYFPGLNGLRAISAIGVVISHITLKLQDFNLDPHIFGSFQDGSPKGLFLAGYGVTIFFVLSGFLITYLLQAEKDIQAIDVRKFYLRRILRIWPLYYIYLFISIIAIIVYRLELNGESLFLYIFYAANIPFLTENTLPFLLHYWSLGSEEQFYLFWPWINKILKQPAVPIIMMIVSLLGIKIALHFLHPTSIIKDVIDVTKFHCMMIGALGAVLFKENNRIFLNLVDNKLSQLICWALIFLVAVNKYHFASVIDTEIIAVAALFLIIGQINIQNRIINLETKIFNFLGKISYGIYVVHPLLIFIFSKALSGWEANPLCKYSIVYFSILSATLVISYFSYKYIESYFLCLKKKFMVVNTARAQA
ncbi:MAG: acyltransferase [Candidatus Omnitrophota bacterium]|jgi:peptidoglycan/LPS O-acetylase OafA/YrhL